MDIEYLYGLIKKDIMVIILIIQKKDTDAFIGMMDINMKDFGKKENKMDMGSYLEIEEIVMDFGVMESLKIKLKMKKLLNSSQIKLKKQNNKKIIQIFN